MAYDFIGTIDPWVEIDTLKAEFKAWEAGKITDADMFLKLANASFSVCYLIDQVQKKAKR